MSTASDIAMLKRQVADLQRRMSGVESGTIGGVGGPVFGPNVITNGDMEAGVVGWSRLFWTGTIGTVSAETANPIDGARSLKVTEAASSSTRLAWLPGGNAGSPGVGSDVFSTTPGDQWLISATLQASVATAHAKLTAVCGTTPPDCYDLPGADTDWVTAVDLPLTANVPSVMQGTISVPAGRNYLAFAVSPDDMSGASGVAWFWLLDDVFLQLRID